MNLTELTKAISEAVSGSGTTQDPATIPIQILDPEYGEAIDIAKVEYDPEDNVIVLQY